MKKLVSGKNIPQSIIENLRLVDVYYYGFDEKLHKGQLVVHKEVVLDIIEIFEFIRETHFPISKVIPISKYDWSDEKSMQDNNTSAFNYRYISGTRVISNHASGLAIDINPMLNPYIKNGTAYRQIVFMTQQKQEQYRQILNLLKNSKRKAGNGAVIGKVLKITSTSRKN